MVDGIEGVFEAGAEGVGLAGKVVEDAASSDPKRRYPALGCLALGAALVIGGLVYLTGFKGPHNQSYKGRVVDEKALYGDVVRGYSTERKGVKGFVERGFNGLLRPGSEMRLYTLEISEVTYDTKSWWQTSTHSLSASELGSEEAPAGDKHVYVQTESDIADIGDRFNTRDASFGRVSKTFRHRGVRHDVKDSEGNSTTIELNRVFKEPSSNLFYKE